jgi:16S rRNA C967 or C1407 C5-methylase (RsmB/RsmF family)
MLSVKQYTLLCTALLCANADTHIVYSTCSINPVENDEVIRKVLKKKADQATLDLPDWTQLQKHLQLEKTEFGYWILPDKTDFGPIYLSRLKAI